MHAGEGLTTVVYPGHVLEELKRIAEADPLREVCGFVVWRPRTGLAVEPVANGADPALVRRRFSMEPLDQLRVLRALDGEGGSVVAVFHSHVDGDARLSRVDREQARAGGALLWPALEQLVIGLRRGRADQIRRYRLGAADFEEYPLD